MSPTLSVGLILAGLLCATGVQAATLLGLVSTGELYASADQGATWSVRSALPVRDAVAVAAGATSSRLYLASAGGVVYGSGDAGSSWTAVGSVAASDVVDLLVKPDLSVVLLTATGTIYRSTDGGATFLATGALTGSNFVSLAISRSGGTLLALSASGEVSRSDDNGATWTTRGAIRVNDAARIRMVQAGLYALTSSGDVYTSTDSGATWIAKGTLSQVGLTSFTSDSGTLIAGAGTGEVATSADGASWTWRGAINQLTVRALGMDTPATVAVDLPGGRPAFEISKPWPNPVQSGHSIAIGFRLPEAREVTLQVFDVKGREVVGRSPQVFGAGVHSLSWEPVVPATGLYFLRFAAGPGLTASTRTVILK